MSRVREEKSLLEKQQGDLFIEEETEEMDNQTKSKNNNPVIDYLDFEDGYERAIAAVFSDELMASINEEHSSYWRSLDALEIPSFEQDITPFSDLIKAPDNLKKRLNYIGLVKNKENIFQLQSNLKN